MPSYTKVQDGSNKILVVTFSNGESANLLDVNETFNVLKLSDSSLKDYLFRAAANQDLAVDNGYIYAFPGNATVTVGPAETYTGHRLSEQDVIDLTGFFMIARDPNTGGGGNHDNE
jgi:hypothetical protein